MAESAAVSKHKYSKDTTAFANPLAAWMSHAQPVKSEQKWYVIWEPMPSARLPSSPDMAVGEGAGSRWLRYRMGEHPQAWTHGDFVV